MRKILLFALLVTVSLKMHAQLTDIAEAKPEIRQPEKTVAENDTFSNIFNTPNTDLISTKKGTDVTFNGYWEYVVYYSSEITNIMGEMIKNNSSNTTSGTLRVKLYFTTSPYSGGTISGWVLFDHTYGTLSPNHYIYNIDWWSDWVSAPSTGYYWATLVLLEYDNGGYYIIDHLNFPSQVYFNPSGNGIEDIQNNRIAITQVIETESILVKIPQSLNPNYTLKIYDIKGRIIYQERIKDYSNLINLSFLSGGLYIASLSDDVKTIFTQKVIIAK